MAKKTKAPAALNWRTGEGYPEHGARTDLWAWEFLRRNPDYRADWRRFLAVADELRGTYSKPYDNLPDNWETDPGRPYWIISKAADEGDTRALVCEPPAEAGESESDWIKRIHASGGRCKWWPLAGALGTHWGLDRIADPALSRLGLDFRWSVSPFGISSPGAHRYSNEIAWVNALNRVAEIMRPDPLSADALTEARALLEKIPAAWDKRSAQMLEDNHPEKHGRFVLEFDLRVSIPEQLKHAGDWLERKQATWRKKGGEVWSDARRNKETPGYATYLRALDAIEQIGENDVTKWRKEIAEAMINGYQSKASYDERKKHLDSVSAWVKRAKKLRDSDYLRLVAITVKPTLTESVSALDRQK